MSNAPCDVSSTIEYVLDGKIDFIALSVASNLDPIGQRTQCTVRPTRTTILGDVLIE